MSPARLIRTAMRCSGRARRAWWCWLMGAWVLGQPLVLAAAQSSAEAHPSAEARSLVDTRTQWPTADQVVRVLLLRDYNTRVVMLGTVILGVGAGVVGVFMLLRKRSLLGDVVSHASLPGIGVAFLALEAAQPGSGKWLPGLLLGALVAGIIGMLATTAIRRLTRIKEDASLAIVLSIFFGTGIALMTMIQSLPTGNQAGLNQFIFGKAASLVADDVRLIGWSSLVVLGITAGLYKEFKILCFDEKYAACQGWPVLLIDLLLMGLVVAVTIIGLQSVGLLLVVAMLIIPAAAARFWTDQLHWLIVAAALIGGGSAILGVAASALFPRLAAGAIIVLMGSAMFGLSLLCGWRRGIIPRWIVHWQVRRRVARQHLLRAFYERLEQTLLSHSDSQLLDLAAHSLGVEELQGTRAWTDRQLKSLLSTAVRRGLAREIAPGRFCLTLSGESEARRIVRNHRLWELYLIHFADVAPTQVDRDADQIEHVLEPSLLAELERKLASHHPAATMPASPHVLGGAP